MAADCGDDPVFPAALPLLAAGLPEAEAGAGDGLGASVFLPVRADEELVTDAGAGLSWAPRTTEPPRQTVRARAIVQTAGREPGKTMNRLAPARGQEISDGAAEVSQRV